MRNTEYIWKIKRQTLAHPHTRTSPNYFKREEPTQNEKNLQQQQQQKIGRA